MNGKKGRKEEIEGFFRSISSWSRLIENVLCVRLFRLLQSLMLWFESERNLLSLINFWNARNVWDLRENGPRSTLRLSNHLAKVDMAQSNYRLKIKALSKTSQNCHKITANKKTMKLFSGTKAHYLHETSLTSVTHGKIAHR